MNWFRKYTRLVKEYVDHLIPEFSEVWSVDEMMVNVKDTEPTGVGFYNWMWTIISPQSRFIIASEVSKRREADDANATVTEMATGAVATNVEPKTDAAFVIIEEKKQQQEQENNKGEQESDNNTTNTINQVF